jgi:hypothetical protein
LRRSHIGRVHVLRIGLAAVIMAGAGQLACRPPRAVHPLQTANPGASFEVRVSGCTGPGANVRRFGKSLRTAMLWSSERVHTATYLPCRATIDAVSGTERHAIYRVSRERDGGYVEEMVRPRP